MVRLTAVVLLAVELAASDVSTSMQWRLNDPGARASQFRAQIQATQFYTQNRAARLLSWPWTERSRPNCWQPVCHCSDLYRGRE